MGGATRTVFAGIKSAYRPEDLEGKLAVVVANLAPRKMKFGVSEGMVLAASGEEGPEFFSFRPTRSAARHARKIVRIAAARKPQLGEASWKPEPHARLQVLFLDIVEYSKKPVAEQLELKQAFNRALATALEQVPQRDRIILDTGDGAAVTFLAIRRMRCSRRSRCATWPPRSRCGWASISARCAW